jgi:hypothetical protein
MNVSEGQNRNNNECLMLKRTIYGVVHTAREFYERLIEVLEGVAFFENKSDLCLLSNWNKKM